MHMLSNVFSTYGQGAEVVQVHRTDSGHTVRVRVRRGAYKSQSFAVVEVFTSALTWTQLDQQPASKWHEATGYVCDRDAPGSKFFKASQDELTGLATVLLGRAVRILMPDGLGEVSMEVVADGLAAQQGWSGKTRGQLAQRFLAEHAEGAVRQRYIDFLTNVARVENAG